MFDLRAGSWRTGAAGGACGGGTGCCSWLAGGALLGGRGTAGEGLDFTSRAVLVFSLIIFRTD